MIARGLLTAACALALAWASPGSAAEGDRAATPADLDFARVTRVEAVLGEDGSWCFHATVRHNDEGWGHYADAWQVLDEQGEEIGVRWLLHPHDDEQPFTRSKCGIAVPPGARTLRVRARCNVHGYGTHEVVLDMSAAEGEGYRIVRKRQ